MGAERSILVTGANKGIGLAICAQILLKHPDTHVFLGSRDAARGDEAAKSLGEARAARVTVLALDVGDDASVAAAAASVASKLGGSKLYGVVNNAGMTGEAGNLAEVLNVNVLGNKRVVDAFAPLLEPAGGRIVFISSAAGPTFVAKCSAAKQKELTDPAVGWADVEAAMAENLALEKAGAGASEYAAQGYGEPTGFMYGYGLSKACVNMLNHVVAREHPGLVVNGCTPGFIATDLTKAFMGANTDGMKSPEHGATSCMHLLFAELEGPSGRYYGSDSVRSPIDRYRGPGDAPYTGP